MTQRGTAPEVLRGVVEATNERGIKLSGRWLNYSQFRQVTRADVGQEVEVEVVRDRFINALTVVGGAPGPEAGGDLTLELDDDPGGGDPFDGFDSPPAGGGPPASGGGPPSGGTARSRPAQGGYGSGLGSSSGAAPRLVADRAPGAAGAAGAPLVDRNTEIRRLALIKAAADYAAGRTKLAPEDVLAIAKRWEGWIIGREPEAGAPGEPGEAEEPDGPPAGLGDRGSGNSGGGDGGSAASGTAASGEA